MTFDQHDIAGALRERADKLQNEVEQASLLGLGDLIDSERHPGELGRWVEDAIRESANGVGPSHGGTHTTFPPTNSAFLRLRDRYVVRRSTGLPVSSFA
jgi:hypothetical protein